ncbi:hypothetical protein B9Z19DRAFT_204555 [Tuber borchii]|uniref:Uncharacterized protein n=1 Tax=Tuber borchii TaxID=42251 RepID=A0A2T6ZNL5_TUBBO|nr:hypothetical protein B9Z19DRAFT_204555 [Tuber borchii]
MRIFSIYNLRRGYFQTGGGINSLTPRLIPAFLQSREMVKWSCKEGQVALSRLHRSKYTLRLSSFFPPPQEKNLARIRKASERNLPPQRSSDRTGCTIPHSPKTVQHGTVCERVKPQVTRSGPSEFRPCLSLCLSLSLHSPSSASLNGHHPAGPPLGQERK